MKDIKVLALKMLKAWIILGIYDHTPTTEEIVQALSSMDMKPDYITGEWDTKNFKVPAMAFEHRDVPDLHSTEFFVFLCEPSFVRGFHKPAAGYNTRYVPNS